MTDTEPFDFCHHCGADLRDEPYSNGVRCPACGLLHELDVDAYGSGLPVYFESWFWIVFFVAACLVAVALWWM